MMSRKDSSLFIEDRNTSNEVQGKALKGIEIGLFDEP